MTSATSKHDCYGIFGGSFDPVHQGHLLLIDQLMQVIPFKELFLVPCKKNVLKENEPSATAQDRLAMLKLAVTEKPRIRIDEREIKRQGESYTHDTLVSFRDQLGEQASICFIMSSDAFQHFDHWHRYRDICRLAHLVVVKRPGYHLRQLSPELEQLLRQRRTHHPQALQQQTSGLILIQALSRKLAVSATSIRQSLSRKLPLSGQLPNQVQDYISEHGLYR